MIMKILYILLLGLFFCLQGCKSPTVAQLSGTEFSANQSDRPKTYVTPEEYDRMTDAERKRLNASVGVSATVATWGKDKATAGKDLTEKEVGEARRN
jgi:hypothetical protein